MNAPHRIAALDLLRGVALLGMVAYHAAYDVQMYWGWDIDVFHGGWKLLARTTAILFLLLSGMAMTLSEQRLAHVSVRDAWQRRLRRAGLIGAAAATVSAGTYLMDAETFVRFGILHLIATGRLLAPCTRRLGAGNVLVGIGVVWIGSFGPWIGSTALLPLGIIPKGFHSVDYFPLLPWYGVILIGSGLIAMQRFTDLLRSIPNRCSWLAQIGRHTLPAYLLHQPALLLLLRLALGATQTP